MKQSKLIPLYLVCFLSLSAYAGQTKNVSHHRNESHNQVEMIRKSADQEQEPVNINTADIHTLQHVKGIGLKRAQAIIDYRQEHGAFKSVDEVSNVKGIGSKRLATISDQLTI